MKPKLLLLHGALGSKKDFADLKQQLTNEFEIYDLNFTGHGGKPVTTDKDVFSIPKFCQDVIQFLDSQSIDKIDIFGYSMGGYVALHAAINYPDRIDQIATLGTKFEWNPESVAKEVNMLNPEKIEEKVPKYAAKLREQHSPADWKQVLGNTAAMMVNLSSNKQNQKLSPSSLSNLQNHITIGWGSADKMVTKEESLQVADMLLNATFKTLEGVPHPINQINPLLIAEYLRSAFSKTL